MCVKNSVRRMYLILHTPSGIQKPEVIGVVKQYPLYRQIFEDTKHRDINPIERIQLGIGIRVSTDTPLTMVELDIPFAKLF